MKGDVLGKPNVPPLTEYFIRIVLCKFVEMHFLPIHILSFPSYRLANCSLSEQSWKYISDVLCQNKTLRHLDISSNDLKDEGLKVLCKALTLPDSVLLTLR